MPLTLLFAACGSDPAPSDAGSVAADARATQDAAAAVPDAGFEDASVPEDAGFVDSGVVPDAGFVDTGVPEDAGFVDSGVSPDAGQVASCEVSLCMAGAFTRSDGANPWFEDLCAQLPGLVTDGNQTMFLFSARDGARDALIAALDDNGDGRVDAQDPECIIRLLGYSWGGVNTTVLGQEFVDDRRVAPERARIHEMYTVDPYAPTAGGTVEVPAEVDVYYELRHSSSPSDDCSAQAPLGPYEGLPPLCYPSTACFDHDYSLAPSLFFMGAQYSWRGDEVGHCGVVDVATPAILHMVRTGQPYPDLPPSVPVGAR